MMSIKKKEKMKAVKLFLALFIIGLAALDLQAQDKLTEAQKKIFQERVTQKVEEFQEGLSNIVNDTLTHDIRKENVVNVLKLFMGEGDPYD